MFISNSENFIHRTSSRTYIHNLTFNCASKPIEHSLYDPWMFAPDLYQTCIAFLRIHLVPGPLLIGPLYSAARSNFLNYFNPIICPQLSINFVGIYQEFIEVFLRLSKIYRIFSWLKESLVSYNVYLCLICRNNSTSKYFCIFWGLISIVLEFLQFNSNFFRIFSSLKIIFKIKFQFLWIVPEFSGFLSLIIPNFFGTFSAMSKEIIISVIETSFHPGYASWAGVPPPRKHRKFHA